MSEEIPVFSWNTKTKEFNVLGHKFDGVNSIEEFIDYLQSQDKEIERLKEIIKKWQDIATRLNNENNNLNSTIREAIELLNYVGWTHYADDEEYLYTLDINFYNKMLKILRGEE